MKTAISLPDPIFDEAEALARRLRVPRSTLYAKALAEFLERHRQDRVTEALDRVYAVQASAVDEALAQMQAVSVPEEEW
jgi:predicted transcriptional regulator